MSFQNFEPFQGQDVAATAPVAAADPAAMAAEPTAVAFQDPAPGEPTAVPAPPPYDGKTTLWYGPWRPYGKADSDYV